MKVPCSPQDFFDSFTLPSKSASTMTKKQIQQQQKDDLYNEKLKQHLSGFSDNIIPTSIPKNNNENQSETAAMATMPPPSNNNNNIPSDAQEPLMLKEMITNMNARKASIPTISKGRTKPLGGLGRGGGRLLIRDLVSHVGGRTGLGGPYGRGRGRGGGCDDRYLGNEDPSLAYASMDTNVTDSVAGESSGYYLTTTTHEIESHLKETGSQSAFITPEKMAIDLESSLQTAVAEIDTNNAFSSILRGIIEEEKNDPNNSNFDWGKWDDDEELTDKPYSTPRAETTTNSIQAASGDLKSPPPNAGSLASGTPSAGINNTANISSSPTPGVPAAAGRGTPPNIGDNVSTDDRGSRMITNPYAAPCNRRGRPNATRKPIISQYNIEVKPKEETAEFQIETIFSNLLSIMLAVDSSAAIISNTNPDAPKITTVAQIPTDAAEMQHYVEDPRTSSSGDYGKLSARLTFSTSIPFPKIKRDAQFATWIRKVGLYFDKSELPTTRTKYIGFFDKKLPHGTRIPFFTHLVNKLVNISKPFQIVSHLVYAANKDENEKSSVQTFAYVMMAAPGDEACILREMSSFKCSHMNFYGWEHFKSKKTPLLTRENILGAMTEYVTPHMSLLFNGFQENVFMRTVANKPSEASIPAAFGDNNRFAALQEDDEDDDMDIEGITRLRIITANPETDDLDDILSGVNMLDFIQEHFVDALQEQIFVQIYGPANGQIEVHYHQDNHVTVQSIEQVLHSTLIRFMSDSAIRQGLSKKHSSVFPDKGVDTNSNSGNQYSQDYRQNVIPLENNVAQPPKRKKPPMFSLCNNDTYHKASVAGRRKIDFPSHLSLTTSSIKTAPVPASSTPSYASTASADVPSTIATTTVVTNTSQEQIPPTQDLSTITTTPEMTQQVVDQITNTIRLEYDQKLVHMNNTMTEIRQDATEAQTLATDVAQDLKAKQQEVISTLDIFTKTINIRFLKQDEKTAETNRLLAVLVENSKKPPEPPQQSFYHQQQQTFHPQAQFFHQPPQQFHPYIMPPVLHLPPEQQQQANLIACLGGLNASSIHNGNRNEENTVAAIAK